VADPRPARAETGEAGETGEARETGGPGAVPVGELTIAPPPARPEPGSGLSALVQALGSVGSVLLVATMLGTGVGGRWHALVAAGTGLVAVLGVVAILVERRRWRSRAVTDPRAAYLRYLDDVVTEAREAARLQRSVLLGRHPAPDALPSLAEEGSHAWRGTDLVVRYGVRDLAPSLVLVPPTSDPLRAADPGLVRAVDRLVDAHAVQPGLPAVVDLRELARIDVCGPTPLARDVARAMVCSAVARHPPHALSVAVAAHAGALRHWDWAKWLPHTGAAPASAEGGERHQLLVVDGQVEPAPSTRTTTLVVGGRPHQRDGADLRLDLGAAGGEGVPVTVVGQDPTAYGALADRCDVATAEALARRLGRLGAEHRAAGPGGSDLLHLLGLPDPDHRDVRSTWARRSARDRLRVPIGADERGEPVVLDLKESAEHGMGPHGLVVGATGSGKSELLRALVLALALTHAPEDLALVLVDFKGGATFAGLAALPHVSALVTNLADELALVDRMNDVLSGELVRRQEVLRAAGDLASVRDHARARAAGAMLEPLPALLVVVDEFSELLTTRPELAELFVAIGRLGRSLGVHLLLASQRLDEGRLRGLEAHLSYRIGLRTFSADESRAVLGVPDAYELPATPGVGYLRAGAEPPVPFRAAFVSGPVPAPRGEHPTRIVPFALGQASSGRDAPPCPATAVLQRAVEGLAGHGSRARRLWLPPLDRPDALDSLMPDLAPDPALGLVSLLWRRRGPLRIPVGTVDRPREQRRDPLVLDLSGAGGYVAVVGGPRSGTSTVLQTIVASLVLTTTPRDTQVYVLDLGASAFAAYDGLPHVAGVAGRDRPDVVRRVVAEVRDVVDRRGMWFRDHDIDSMTTYRNRRARGRDDDGYGDVFLVVDGWGALRADFEDLEADLQHLAARGLGYGCHLLTAARRWADYRPAVRDLLGTRIELRLGDPADSELDRRAAARVPRDRPGRGVVEGPFQVLTALPRIDGDADPDTLATGIRDLVGRVTAAWPGSGVSRLRLLPTDLTTGDLLGTADVPTLASRRLLLGVRERDVAPVGLDPDSEPHWLVLGDPGSGRTTALRGYLDEVVRTRSSEDAQVVLVDPRRSLLAEVPDAYLLHHLTTAGVAAQVLAELASYLESRLPGPDVTPAQLRDRSWWTGAEVHVVVDDHDLVAHGQGSPLLALEPLLAQAGDVGLHLVVARRCGGAARALYEPVLRTLRDLGAPVLLLSGTPDEGPLAGGVRPCRLPPGRGLLVTRDRVETVQLARREPTG
jgi:S-DNA-T family DNA segregation ATPase FtsK/SpoIIIE